jgi:hypothetical protein
MMAQPLDDANTNLFAAIGAMFEQVGGDDQAEHDGAGMDADCTGADDDAESTLEIASNAGVDISVKDSLLCSFPTCENVRMVKHDKCKDHRKLFENALSDATLEDAAALKKMSYDNLEDIFQKRALAGAGPPGRGTKKRSFDYAKFFHEKKTSSFNQGHVVCEPVTHFRFMKRMAEEKNWSAEKADKMFWERAADKVRYPERDFLGDDDCSCNKPACCEGRLRIKMPVQEQNIIGHRAESSSIVQSGDKEKNIGFTRVCGGVVA